MVARGYFGHNGGAVFGLLDARRLRVGRREHLPQQLSRWRERRCCDARLDGKPDPIANILHGSFTRVGVGCVKDSSGMKYCTMVFIG